MAVSKRLRYEVLRRDNHTCRYCGRSAPDVKLAVDHIKPQALGGPTEPTNLVTACDDCNSGKTSTVPDSSLVEDVEQDALRWSRGIAAAAASMLADHGTRQDAYRQFTDAWHGLPRPAGWENSVDAFLAAGLPLPVLLRCVDQATSNPKIRSDHAFRYMCGIAWTRVTEIQNAAKHIVAAQPPRHEEDDEHVNLANYVLSAVDEDDRKMALRHAAHDWSGNEVSREAQEMRAASLLIDTVIHERAQFAKVVEAFLQLLDSRDVARHRNEAEAAHERIHGAEEMNPTWLVLNLARAALDTTAVKLAGV